jgi:hypothetical protein
LSDKGLPFFLKGGVYSPSNPIFPKNEMACMDIKASAYTHFTLKICKHQHLQVPEKDDKKRALAKKINLINNVKNN